MVHAGPDGSDKRIARKYINMNKVIITIGVFFTLSVITSLTVHIFKKLKGYDLTDVQSTIPIATEDQIFIGLRPPTKFRINDLITRKDGFVHEWVIKQQILINKIAVNPVSGKLEYFGTTITQFKTGNIAVGSAEIDVEAADKLYSK